MKNFIESLIELITNKDTHIYKGKSGTYWKKGSSSSGRKGKTLLFWEKKK